VSKIPTSDWTWINAAADRFERAWKQDPRPRIEDYLAEVEESQRPALLEELLRVDVELRIRDGEEPGPDDYAARFPHHTSLIRAVFDPGPALSAAAGSRPRDADPTTAHLTPGEKPTRNGEPEPGDRVRYFGDYEIQQEIGRGGMGVVYRARQISLNRLVALKMLRDAALASADELRRFQNEAEAVARLDHPHIVPVYEVGEHDGRCYFSMKLISGPSLHEALSPFTADPRAAAALMVTVADAVHHAHQRGILHRDLKPSNILLDDRSQPHVTDFGLAKRAEGDEGVTPSLAVLGTPGYMAPEQAWGKKRLVTTLSDVYGLGAILYALLTGKAPFAGETVLETLDQVRLQPPVAPSRIDPKVPRDLETICLKCLEKDPARRYASAEVLAGDLSRYLAGEPILARPVGMAERAVMWARRSPAIAGLLGLVALVSALGLGGVLWQWRTAVVARRDAEQASRRATSQTELAEERLQDSLRARATERQQTELAEQRLYDARMNVVQSQWEDYCYGDIMRRGLDAQLPANQGGIDRRGFEWFYWQRQLSSGHITVQRRDAGFNSVAYSPDGQRLAAAGTNGTVRVWDAKTRQETLTFRAHAGQVKSLAFSADGQYVASAGEDATAKLWIAATGREIRTFRGHTDSVNSVAFSPDGHRLASAGRDWSVRLWDAPTGREIHTLKGHTKDVMNVAFSPDGRLVASASMDHTVKLWDAATGTEIRALDGHRYTVFSVAFSPDGKQLVSGRMDRTLKFWNAATGQEIRTLKGHREYVNGVAFSPDGRWLVSAGDDSAVKIWDAVTGNEIRTLKGHISMVKSVAFGADGRHLASAGIDGVKVWDAGPAQEALTLKGSRVAFSPDGKRLASISDGVVKLWDAATGGEILTFKGRAKAVNSLSFRPDGRVIASAGADKTVMLWDVANALETLTLRGHTDDVMNVAFSPDGRRVASASRDHTVKLWDAATGKEIHALIGHRDTVFSVAFSPDGRRLASASIDAVRLWDAQTGREALTLSGHRGYIYCVVFSPDGQWLAAAYWDRTVRLWDAQTGQVTLRLKGHGREVNSLAFSPDGRRVASASWDSTVKLWDVSTGQETLTLKEHSSWVRSVTFSPDGRRLASASDDGTVKVWDARPLDDETAKSGARPQ
jgi:WD40 repeat protein/tRNA A-37 threonylcarbamoyl transferase component Bud32